MSDKVTDKRVSEVEAANESLRLDLKDLFKRWQEMEQRIEDLEAQINSVFRAAPKK